MDFLRLEWWVATVLLTCICVIWFAFTFSWQNRICQTARFELFTGGCGVRTMNSKRSVFTCYVSWLEKNMFWFHLIVHLLSRRQVFLFKRCVGGRGEAFWRPVEDPLRHIWSIKTCFSSHRGHSWNLWKRGKPFWMLWKRFWVPKWGQKCHQKMKNLVKNWART